MTDPGASGQAAQADFSAIWGEPAEEKAVSAQWLDPGSPGYFSLLLRQVRPQRFLGRPQTK